MFLALASMFLARCPRVLGSDLMFPGVGAVGEDSRAKIQEEEALALS